MADTPFLPANFVNPAYATPEQIASQREYAKFLTDNSMQPVRHWTEGVANLTRALMGGYQSYKADEAQRGLNQGTAQQYAALLGMTPGASTFPASTPAASPPAPPNTGDYATRTAAVESSGNPNARATTSSASGLYGFTDGTWADMMRRHPELGLTADGRTDPGQSKRALDAFTADNAAQLRQGGVPTDDKNLRMAHFLGAGGAAGFIGGMNRDPNAPATGLVSPAAARANPSIFFDKAGNALPAQAVYDRVTAGFGGAPAANTAQVQGLPPAAGGPVAPAAPLASPAGLSASPVAAPAAPMAAPPIPAAAPAGSAAAPPTPGAAIASPGIDDQQKRLLIGMLMNPATAPMAQKLVGEIIQRQVVPNNPDWVPIGDNAIVDKKTGRIVQLPDVSRKTNDIKNYDAYVAQTRAAGQVPKTLEQYEIGLKQAGAMTNNIALNTEKKGQELLATKAIEGYDAASTAARDSQKRIAAYDEMERAAKAFQPGATAEARLTAKRYLRDAGLIAGDDVPDQEVFRMLQQQLAVHAQPKGQGAVSNFEREMFARALPNMSMSPEALSRGIDINRKLEKFDMNVAQIYRDNARKNGGIPNYLEVQDQIAALGSPLSDADHRLIREAAARTPAAGGAAAAPATPAKTLRLNPATGEMEPVQ